MRVFCRVCESDVFVCVGVMCVSELRVCFMEHANFDVRVWFFVWTKGDVC